MEKSKEWDKSDWVDYLLIVFQIKYMQNERSEEDKIKTWKS